MNAVWTTQLKGEWIKFSINDIHNYYSFATLGKSELLKYVSDLIQHLVKYIDFSKQGHNRSK